MIRFVGKGTYTPPDNPEESYRLAIKVFEKIESIISRIDSYLRDYSINEKWVSKSLKKEEDFLFFAFRIDSDLFEDHPEKREPIIEFLDEIKVEINNIWNDIGTRLFRMYGWSTYSFDITVRPHRGHYNCPVCGECVEDSEMNKINFHSEDLLVCPNPSHGSVFLNDSALRKKVTKGELIYSNKNKKIVKLIPRDSTGYRIYEEMLREFIALEKGLCWKILTEEILV